MDMTSVIRIAAAAGFLAILFFLIQRRRKNVH